MAIAGATVVLLATSAYGPGLTGDAGEAAASTATAVASDAGAHIRILEQQAADPMRDDAGRHAAGTTTGFATQDFAAWPSFLPVMMLFFSFMGGCVGSTGGGMKVARILLLFKHAQVQLFRLIHPLGQTPEFRHHGRGLLCRRHGRGGRA